MGPWPEGTVRYLRSTFRSSSTWKAASIYRFTTSQVLLRTRDFCIVEVITSHGTKQILKVSKTVLPYLSTQHPCVVFLWCKHGCWQAGIKLPGDDELESDDFIMNDHPDILPGVSDPSFVPRMNDFQPWAMEYEKFDRVFGYGLTQPDDSGTELWSLALFSSSLTSTTESMSRSTNHTSLVSTTESSYTW